MSQRLIVTTITTRKVHEQWVVEVPDDLNWEHNDYMVYDAFFDRLAGEEDDPKYLVLISGPKFIGEPDVADREILTLEEAPE